MRYADQINTEGFTIIDNVYTNDEIKKLILLIESVTESEVENTTFRKSQDLFAIRQFHNEIPQSIPFIFNQKLNDIIESTFGKGYFITKSIILIKII